MCRGSLFPLFKGLAYIIMVIEQPAGDRAAGSVRRSGPWPGQKEEGEFGERIIDTNSPGRSRALLCTVFPFSYIGSPALQGWEGVHRQQH